MTTQETERNDTERRLRELVVARWRLAVALTAATVVLYFGFILLIAFDRPLMGRLIVPGLSVGVLLGAAVIVCSWLLTWVYVRWANTKYDPVLHELRGR